MRVCLSPDAALAPDPHTDIEVSCYTYEGIEAVKTALRAGLAVSTEAQPVKVWLLLCYVPLSCEQINLIAPPLYVVTTTSLDKEAGIALLTTVRPSCR